jgi:hypothetical protein
MSQFGEVGCSQGDRIVNALDQMLAGNNNVDGHWQKTRLCSGEIELVLCDVTNDRK